MLTLGTSLVLVVWNEANSGCGHHIGGVRKEDLETGQSGIFPPRCQISCMPNATAVETSTPDVDFGGFFGVGGVEGSQLRMWSSHWKGPKKKASKQVNLGFLLAVASCHSSPAPRRLRQAPLMLTLGTSLVSMDWKEANSGCGHHIGRVRKEDLKTGPSGILAQLPVFMQAQRQGGFLHAQRHGGADKHP